MSDVLILYHGTAAANRAGIKERRLVPPTGRRGPFLTTSRAAAARYAVRQAVCTGLDDQLQDAGAGGTEFVVPAGVAAEAIEFECVFRVPRDTDRQTLYLTMMWAGY